MVGPRQGAPLRNYALQQNWFKRDSLKEGRGVRTWSRGRGSQRAMRAEKKSRGLLETKRKHGRGAGESVLLFVTNNLAHLTAAAGLGLSSGYVAEGGPGRGIACTVTFIPFCLIKNKELGRK